MAEITLPDNSFTLTAYTITETAAALKVSTRTVRRYLSDGKLKGAKIGGKWLISRESLVAFCNGD